MPATTVAATPVSHESALKRFAVHHPLIAYFVIAFAVMWVAMLPMVLSVDGLGLLDYQVPFAAWLILFLLGSFGGPSLGAYLVTWALEGRAGMRRLLRRYGQWRVGAWPWLIAVFGYPLIYLAGAALQYGAEPLRGLAAQPLTFFTAYLPALLIFPALITWGEEPGWRGFALTRMQPVYGPLVAALVVGMMHGLWHLPVFLLKSGPVALGPFDLAGFLGNTLLSMIVSITWTWVFNLARGSILIAVLLHASGNAVTAWIGLFAPQVVNGENSIISYAILVAPALLVLLATRGKLGYARPVDTL